MRELTLVEMQQVSGGDPDTNAQWTQESQDIDTTQFQLWWDAYNYTPPPPPPWGSDGYVGAGGGGGGGGGWGADDFGQSQASKSLSAS